jgi:hypothetical protein
MQKMNKNSDIWGINIYKYDISWKQNLARTISMLSHFIFLHLFFHWITVVAVNVTNGDSYPKCIHRFVTVRWQRHRYAVRLVSSRSTWHRVPIA